MMLVVLRTQIHVFRMFVSGLSSDQSEFMALFMALNLWVGPSFIFESCS